MFSSLMFFSVTAFSNCEALYGCCLHFSRIYSSLILLFLSITFHLLMFILSYFYTSLCFLFTKSHNLCFTHICFRSISFPSVPRFYFFPLLANNNYLLYHLCMRIEFVFLGFLMFRIYIHIFLYCAIHYYFNAKVNNVFLILSFVYVEALCIFYFCFYFY